MDLIDIFTGFTKNYLFWIVPTSVNATDVAEIIILSFLFYEFLAWVRRTRAWTLIKGIIIILVFIIIAALLQMNTILYLAGRLVNVGILAIIILFQPELRNALEHLGRKNIFAGLFSVESVEEKKDEEHRIEEVTAACQDMSRTKTGALIVFENKVALDEYIRTGIELDSVITRQLLRNIFVKNTPLHDGAIIIRGGRIKAATCYLPLSDNREINKDYGTRHRAAVGMSEVSDSLTVVVSEETGHISIAQDGYLYPDLTTDGLKERLSAFYEANRSDGKKHLWNIKGHMKDKEAGKDA